MEWTQETVNDYKDRLNKRVAELAGTGRYDNLYDPGQIAKSELLSPEDEASLEEWRTRTFYERLKTLRDRK